MPCKHLLHFGLPALVVCLAAVGQESSRRVVFSPIPPEVVQARLQQPQSQNDRRQAALRRLFEEAGCGERLSEQPVKGSRVPNLVCAMPGTTEAEILVGAHFDKVSAGAGIADNWSGAALLPTLFQSLRHHVRRHTFVFVGFTDEEEGLKGSAFYARQLGDEHKTRVRAMVNLDTLGLDRTSVWVSRADPKLLAALERVAAAMLLPLQGVSFEQVGSTDSESFRKRKIPSITLHSVTQGTYKLLHSAGDNAKAIRFDHYYDTYRLVAAYLAYLDETLD